MLTPFTFYYWCNVLVYPIHIKNAIDPLKLSCSVAESPKPVIDKTLAVGDVNVVNSTDTVVIKNSIESNVTESKENELEEEKLTAELTLTPELVTSQDKLEGG